MAAAGQSEKEAALHASRPQPQDGETKPHTTDSVEKPGGAGRAVFLHTGWRSRGTWIWSRCREQAGVAAFYEPLHEHLARLGAAEIKSLRPGSWASSHSETAPYFQEYGRVLPPGGRGVPLYRQRFAFHDFFLPPDADDPALEAYLGSLLAAAEPGQAGVVKFCRSLGRVGWLERRFPNALHAVVLRDPMTQWASAQALLVGQRNRYFAIAPLMVLARNAGHPLVRQATAALGVRLPALHSDDLAYATEISWWHLKRLDEAARYRTYLAFWCATAVQALDSTALLLDAARLAGDDDYRSGIEAAFAMVTGPGLSLAPRQGAAQSPPRLPGIPPTAREAAELAELHASARALVGQLGAALDPARLAFILALLPSDSAAASPMHPVLTNRPTPAPPRRHGGARLVTWAVVLAARALQPIRRLHGALASRQGDSF